MAYRKNINQKLESFMKRNLPSGEYQKIRCYERCVVDKTMKLALLTSKNLIITDFPPRTLHYTLPLSDCMSVSLVQDLPDFLHGNEKLTSQHISMKFKHELKERHTDLKKSGSQSSFVSGSSGEASSETSPNNSVSGSSLYATLWQDTLSPYRTYKHNNLTPDRSFDKTAGRIDRLNLSDSDTRSLSSQSFSSQTSTSDLDLFILTDSAYFYKLLKAATLNYKIADTKRLDFSSTEGRVGSSRRRKSSARELQLYTQLSEEIRCSKGLEDRFLLVKELHTAAASSPNIKLYFWKDTDLCKEIVEQIRYYLHNTHCTNNRADELEYLILLKTCLSEMFRESDHLSHRMYMLTANSNGMFKSILDCCSSKPLVPIAFSNSTEVESLCHEVTEAAVVLLFELGVTVAQHPKYGVDLTTSHFILELEAASEKFSPVLCSIVERALCFMSRTITAHRTLVIYHMFYILDMLCRHSGVYGELLRDRFSDDIKYYCQSPESKILRYSPLQSLAIDKVNSVVRFISSGSNR